MNARFGSCEMQDAGARGAALLGVFGWRWPCVPVRQGQGPSVGPFLAVTRLRELSVGDQVDQYELTGALPYVSPNSVALLRAKLNEEPQPPSCHVPGFNPSLEAIILKALEREPRHRYASASDLLKDLENPAAVPPRDPLAGRPPRRPMAEKGLVERKDNPGDRRSYALQLTDRGRATLDEIGRVAREHGDAICAALSAAEREELADLLRRLAEEQGLTPGVHPGHRRL